MISFYLILFLEWFVRIAFSLRVIMRRSAVATSLAWLTIILLLPIAGAVTYLLIGEKRLGFYRARWVSRLYEKFRPWRERLAEHEYKDWDHSSEAPQLARLVTRTARFPTMANNKLQLMDSAEVIFRSMIDDINAAQHRCFLEYYIWEVGGLADEVADALSSAAARGVDCRILVDAVGSRGFLKSEQARKLQTDGIQIRAALPAGIFRALFFRFDLRLHRKIAVFDRKVAYVGSQNMADPKKFQAGAGFGQWIDAMTRIEGPAIDPLLLTLYADWQLETLDPSLDIELPSDPEPVPCTDSNTAVQVVPSGPNSLDGMMEQALLCAIYMADHRLVMTTPYFVPNEALQTALISAARRGVDVTILMPSKVNSIFVKLANRPFLRELISVGVHIAHYQDGMLHTKSVVVDEHTCMFGSLNLDPRSLHLNFEITLMIYDKEFVQLMSELQKKYLSNSTKVTTEDVQPGSFGGKLIENCVRLLAPLL